MADAGQRQVDKQLQSMERKINKVYSQASKEVQGKLDDYMRRFKIKDEIKRKALKQGKITEAEYKQWRLGQVMIGKRWEEMQTVLATNLTNANKLAASIINDHTPDAYAIGSNYATFEVEVGSMLNTSFTLYDRHTVERLMKENPKLLPKARVDIPKDLRWNKQKLNSAITQGVLQGEDLNKVSKRLQSVTDMNRSSAIRNARTMMTSAENGGRFNSYLRAENLGINMEKQWLATPDGRTRHSHAAQDGEHVPIKEEFSNGLMFPADPDGDPREVYNCRCTMVAAIGDMNYETAPDDLYNVPDFEDMDFDEWESYKKPMEISDKQQRDLIGTVHNLKDDHGDVDNMIKIADKEIIKQSSKELNILRRAGKDLPKDYSVRTVKIAELETRQKWLDKEKLEDMASSKELSSIISVNADEVIRAMEYDGHVILLDGNHRANILKLLGKRNIQVYVRKI